MIRSCTLLCLWLCCACFVNAQSIGPSQLNTMGTSTIVGGMTVEQSLGAVVAGNTYISASLIVTPNVLQPKVDMPNGVVNPAISTQIVTVFPNPTDQIIFIQAYFQKKQTMDCIITDVLGRVLMQQSFVLEHGNERQEMNLGALAVGQYHLNIRWKEADGDFNRAFKIQKVN